MGRLKKFGIFLLVILIIAAAVALFVYSVNKDDVQPEQLLNDPILGSDFED